MLPLEIPYRRPGRARTFRGEAAYFATLHLHFDHLFTTIWHNNHSSTQRHDLYLSRYNEIWTPFHRERLAPAALGSRALPRPVRAGEKNNSTNTMDLLNP
jgi:hypothetical protein